MFEILTSTPQRQPESDKSTPSRSAWYWLLLLPLIGLAVPALYAHQDPALFGFPFFYWYQFAWVILSALISGLVYWQTRDANNGN